VVPARRHCYYWNSYGNCGGGDRKMVHSLTPEHLAIANGVILNGLNQAWVIVSKPTALPAIASGQGKFRLGRDCGWVGIITAS